METNDHSVAPATAATPLRQIDAKGLLFIGDPHISSRRPGRRTDADFMMTVIGKLAQAIEIANDSDLVPVILGDLYDDGAENDNRLNNHLIGTLKKSKLPIYDLLGNHTLTLGRGAIHHESTDRHAIQLLEQARALNVFSGAGDADVAITTPHGRIYLGGVAWGQPIPAVLGPHYATQSHDANGMAEINVLITHHDLNFPNFQYPATERFPPGNIPIKKIKGADLVINGHVHDCRKPVIIGKTAWFNPGNITRMSIDLENHIPSVFSFLPGTADSHDPYLEVALPHGLKRHVLVHDARVFDATGRRIAAIAPDHAGDEQAAAAARQDPDATPDWQPAQADDSQFVALLKSEIGPKTEDASGLREELAAIYAEKDIEPPVQDFIASMIMPK